MTLDALVAAIANAVERFKIDYDIVPFDVCLGPEEFKLLYYANTTDENVPQFHNSLAPMFYKGMRVRLLSSPGICVGCLVTPKPNKGHNESRMDRSTTNRR